MDEATSEGDQTVESERRETLAGRIGTGKERRSSVPRAAHGAWGPAPDRPDPIALLQQFDGRRLPHLLPIRYGRMMASPLNFLRGAAAVMAYDLASTPTTGLHVQLCGDAHLANFGAYATAERNLVFGINDFDETLPGPWEWDIKRLVTSIVVAGRSNELRTADCSAAAEAAARSYRMEMAKYREMGYMALYYAQVDEGAVRSVISTGAQRKALQKSAARARGRDNLHALAKLTTFSKGRLRIKDDPPLVTHISDPTFGDVAQQSAQKYIETLQADRVALLRRYVAVDAALKVVGVASVGTHCFIVLLVGATDQDPLFLQIKQADASVHEAYLGVSAGISHGQRVVMGQRMLQPASDVFLGWGSEPHADFYVRQLRDMKGTMDVTTMGRSPLNDYAGLCGWALALAHARSGDAAAIAGYLGKGDSFDRALLTFAHQYADQTEKDHAALVKAVNEGRVPAQPGV